MNLLDNKTRSQIIHMLVEGNSLRATARMADVSRNTVDKLLREVGAVCLDYQDENLRDLKCKRVQCDEIWSFVYSKQKNVPEEMRDVFGVGDVWTWVAMCADTKIVPCWHVDNRGVDAVKRFMDNLAGRLTSRVQLTTDGHRAYLEAVENSFGGDIDYTMLVKIYGGDKEQQKRDSPAKCEGIHKRGISGSPNKKHVSTNHIEREDLTMRMSMRRFTRLTNAFSKKIENHMHAISLHYMYYNFCRVHQTLSVTPAMEAGVAEHIWSIEEIVGLLPKPVAKKRGKHTPRKK